MKKDIRSLSLKDLCSFFESNNYPSFRGKQVYNWLWSKSCFSFDEMTNISLQLRNLLKSNFIINHIKIDDVQKSNDGTIKNAVKLFDNLFVESVLIPVKNRTTACISSQVGCSLDCEFCATSRLKRMRNLNPDEIFDQASTINLQSKLYYDRPISNIVFMGMGEPLLNYKNLILGIEKIPPLVARGLVIDVASYLGRSHLAAGETFSLEELKGAINSQNIKIEKGDVVLMHTGWTDAKFESDPASWGSGAPGITPEIAEYLASKEVLAVGADTWSLDVVPPMIANEPYPGHGILLQENGIYILEAMNTGPLVKDKVSEFLFILGQAKVRGAVQMIVNPIGIR